LSEQTMSKENRQGETFGMGIHRCKKKKFAEGGRKNKGGRVQIPEYSTYRVEGDSWRGGSGNNKKNGWTHPVAG